jgi:multidrug efflux pump subunit AcrA (membrane-fusion protein)
MIFRLPSVSVRGSRDNDDLVPLHEPFEVALRGFNRRQVLEHLESLDGRVAMVAADRDAALAQVAELSKVLNHLRLESELLDHLRREEQRATSQVERLLAAPMAEASARIQRILRLAEEEAAELKANAEAEIAAKIARADQDIAELRSRADDHITELRARAGREAKSLLEHARRQCDQLETDFAARREAAEQESAQAIAERESATNARIRDGELRSLARLHLMLQVIGDHLKTRLDAAERDEAALREVRAQVAGEVSALEMARTDVTATLAATHQLLAGVLGQVRKTPSQRIPSDRGPGKTSELPPPPVPVQRSAEGGTVYHLNPGADDRRLPRTPH